MTTPAARFELEPTPSQAWRPATRLVFRFCFLYFSLYCLSNQIITGLFYIPNVEIPDPATLWPTRQIVTWMAVHIFRVHTELVYFSGSGDKTFDWVLVFFLLVVSIIAAGIWSVLDGRRENYAVLYKWFRLFLRFALAGQMFGYGLSKAIPVQMPFPSLTRLLEAYGNFSPMGVLWSSIGASPAYEIFAGCAETLGGILLIIPRTTTLGALVCLADMVQVFMLNMTYDVPVKLFSFHLIVLSLFLLAPDFERLANFFFLNRPAPASSQPRLFNTERANRVALLVQLVFGLWLMGLTIYGSWTEWWQYGGGRPKSPFYGIWEVKQLNIEGQARLPLLSDNDRWRRVIFDFPARTTFQRMDDSLVSYGTSIDSKAGTLKLTKNDDKNWKANFFVERPAPDQLVLDGDMDNHKVHMELQLFDRNKFLLVNRGFHWVQEYPFNR